MVPAPHAHAPHERRGGPAGIRRFLATNLTVSPGDWPAATWPRQWRRLLHAWAVFPVVQRVRAVVGHPHSGAECLANPHLANPLAVSCLLANATGRLGVVRRSSRAAVSSGQWATTVAGTVTMADVMPAGGEHPVFRCARREALEELGIELPELQWDGLVVSRQKLQPVALVFGRLARSWEELALIIPRARDWRFENTAIYAMPPDLVPLAVRRLVFTDAAAYHLWLHRGPARRLLLQIDRHRVLPR